MFVLGACNTEGPTESDPCSILVDGIYQYPTEPADPSWSKERKKEYWDIPEDILKCISTKGLVESCFSTPKAAYIIASNGCQDGYNLVKSACRGYDELELRDDAAEELINKYETIKPLEVDIFQLFMFEMALAQNSILEKMTTKQKSKLLELALFFLAEKRKVVEGDYFNWEASTIIMGRMMLFENYTPFEEVCVNNDKIQKFITNGYQLSIADANIINFFANQFVNHITQ